jgi:nucleoside-diphosphate-sugar epimerase
MKRAIITGATGAIGLALLQDLINNGIEVLVFCRKDSERNARLPYHQLVHKVDYTLEELDSISNHTGKTYDVFYHFAWAGTVGEERNDMYLQQQNVKYALDAVSCAFRFGCKSFIGAGSQAEYGRVEGVLYPNTPTHPETGYGMAKLSAGYMTREYAHQIGIKHIWVRILSVYGPGDSSQSMVMSTITKLRRGETPELTKGEQVWDYLYSGDAARAFRMLGVKSVEKIKSFKKLESKTYVLGSGHGKALTEYVHDIRDVVAPGVALTFGAIPYGERQVMHLVADISDLNNDVGFIPEMLFIEGIRHTIENISI